MRSSIMMKSAILVALFVGSIPNVFAGRSALCQIGDRAPALSNLMGNFSPKVPVDQVLKRGGREKAYEKHVGASMEFLHERAEKEVGGGPFTTFANEGKAKLVLAQVPDALDKAMLKNPEKAAEWLAGKGDARFVIELDVKGSLGRGVEIRQGVAQAVDPATLTRARVVLYRQEDGQFVVYTAFPIPGSGR